MLRCFISAFLSLVAAVGAPAWAGAVEREIPQLPSTALAVPQTVAPPFSADQAAAAARLLDGLAAVPSAAALNAMPAAERSQLVAASLLADPRVSAAQPHL